MKLKIVTLNIWHGGRVWDGAIEFLRKENPDILLMQEVFNGHDTSVERRFRTVDEFNRLFDFTDNDFAPAMMFVESFGKLEQGNAIFSKFPITQRYEPVFFNEPYNNNYQDIRSNFPYCPRNLQHIVVDVQGTELDVLNFQGSWDMDGDNDSPQRRQMSQAIIDAVQGRPNVILGGDTNARPTSPAIRAIDEHLINVFGTELETTFNLDRKDLVNYPGYADSVVDMLFTSPHIKVVEHYCPEVDASDHLPLVMTVSLKQGQ